MARWLADYPEWSQLCWDFVKPPRNDKIASDVFFFLLAEVQEFFSILFVLHAIFSSKKRLQEIFFQNHPPPPPPSQELNDRPLNGNDMSCISF